MYKKLIITTKSTSQILTKIVNYVAVSLLSPSRAEHQKGGRCWAETRQKPPLSSARDPFP